MLKDELVELDRYSIPGTDNAMIFLEGTIGKEVRPFRVMMVSGISAKGEILSAGVR